MTQSDELPREERRHLLERRHPVVLRHMIEHPPRILADSTVPGAYSALDIVAEDGTQNIITIHRRPALPEKVEDV